MKDAKGFLKKSVNTDQPRERLWQLGEEALSPIELLAIVMGSGVRGCSVMDLSQRLWQQFGGFRKLAQAGDTELLKIKGMGLAKLARIRALLEIGRRMSLERVCSPAFQVKDSVSAYQLLAPQMRDLKKEVFKVILLDNQSHVISIQTVTKGTVNWACPIIREIFHKVFDFHASALICAHNHPSGILRPSEADKRFTKKISQTAKLLQIQFLDHIIISPQGYLSFIDRGWLENH